MMSDDIVNQLRYPIVEDEHLTTELIACRHIMREAADEIERLRKALARIEKINDNNPEIITVLAGLRSP